MYFPLREIRESGVIVDVHCENGQLGSAEFSVASLLEHKSLSTTYEQRLPSKKQRNWLGRVGETESKLSPPVIRGVLKLWVLQESSQDSDINTLSKSMTMASQMSMGPSDGGNLKEEPQARDV